MSPVALVAALLVGLSATAATATAAAAATRAPADARLVVREEWIPMRDGTKLAVNLFFPAGLHAGTRLPVILEYLPYRKDDWSVARDVADYSYFVRRGFVAARLDLRGTGRSEGRPPDREYSESEQRDGMEAIAWLARRPWSNGNVGMTGISWGGFNAIQLAMRRPPALKAILAVDASDRLFHGSEQDASDAARGPVRLSAGRRSAEAKA